MSRKRTPSKRNSLTTSELVVPGNDIGSQITSSLPNLRHDSSADLKQANGLYEREQYADGAETVLLRDEILEKKRQNLLVRTTWTFIMIGGFFACVALGHLWVVALIATIQVIVFKELNEIAKQSINMRSIPSNDATQWYFFIVSMYYIYGESLIYYFKHILFADDTFMIFALHHRFISAVLYIIGFLSFVASLSKGHYRGQFMQFCWTHMIILFTVFQSAFVLNNIFEGLFWFFLPCSLVIINDIFAYVCGYIWGRTQLIQLSPKKTVEGFVGGWICTMILGIVMANVLMQFKYLICPANDLGVTAWSGLDCNPNPVFTSHTYQLHPDITAHLPNATFASLIAPFGGFFASGLKRAFQIKDFGDSIPGHGGLTDRMDCQFMMGFFSHLYFEAFVTSRHVTVGSVLQTALTHLTLEEQVELATRLKQYLTRRGLTAF